MHSYFLIIVFHPSLRNSLGLANLLIITITFIANLHVPSTGVPGQVAEVPKQTRDLVFASLAGQEGVLAGSVSAAVKSKVTWLCLTCLLVSFPLCSALVFVAVVPASILLQTDVLLVFLAF